MATWFNVGFLDAGQGDCTIIIYPDNSITLVDCGSTKNGAIVAGPIQNALNLWLPKNNNTINNLVITHADADHYNLIDTVLVNVANPPTINNIYYGCDLSLYPAAMQTWITNTFPTPGVNRFSPGGGAAFFSPNPDPNLSRAGVNAYILSANCTGNSTAADGPSKNANSIVLMLEYEDARIFLMGDGTAVTEGFIINAAAATGNQALLTKVWKTALKMGHHGSNSSSTPAWITAIQPDSVFVSSDTRTFNGTGMPSDTLLNAIVGGTALDAGANLHRYVQFNTASTNFEAVPIAPAAPIQTQLCSTLYDVQPNGPGNFASEGGSWYYSVVITSATQKQIVFGFTG